MNDSSLRIFDSHAHLDILHHKNPTLSVEAVIDRARAANVFRIVQVGVDEASNDRSRQISADNESVVYSMGLHPSGPLTDRDIQAVTTQIHDALDDSSFRAIGEVGLDYYWIKEPKAQQRQREVLLHFINIATKLRKPLIIHCRPAERDAYADCLQILRNASGPECIVMHCFSGTAKHADEFLRLGCYLSFAGNVTFRNASILQSILPSIDRHRILLETDSPYLSPVPLRGRINEPAHITHTLHFLADLLDIDVGVLASIIWQNTHRVFDL